MTKVKDQGSTLFQTLASVTSIGLHCDSNGGQQEASGANMGVGRPPHWSSQSIQVLGWNLYD